MLSGEVKPNETPAELEKTPVVEIMAEEKEVEVAEVLEPEPVPTSPPVVEVPVAATPEPTPEPELPKTA